MQGLFGTHNKVAHIRVDVSIRVDEQFRSRVETASETISRYCPRLKTICLSEITKENNTQVMQGLSMVLPTIRHCSVRWLESFWVSQTKASRWTAVTGKYYNRIYQRSWWKPNTHYTIYNLNRRRSLSVHIKLCADDGVELWSRCNLGGGYQVVITNNNFTSDIP